MKALISVSDKTNIIEIATLLHEHGIELISTGGTETAISKAGLPVKNISSITGFPEILDGRVKTLHPNVHGGLLGRTSLPAHVQQMQEHHIEHIDFVIVNLYPFKNTITKPDVSYEDCIENIDIGGPSMLRSAAKNYEEVIVLCDPSDYLSVFEKWKDNLLTIEDRKSLAAKVFRHTAAYDSLIAGFLTSDTFPEKISFTYEKQASLRYGENPHQQAALYVNPIALPGSICGAMQLHGKELSYNNIQDADAAVAILSEFETPCAVAIKHANPCGVGMGSSIHKAFQRCYDADAVSIFGGIVALNKEVDQATAAIMQSIFLEIIIAPSFSEEALTILQSKKNLRLLQMDASRRKGTLKTTSIYGGLLVQEEDNAVPDLANIKTVTQTAVSDEDLKAALFLWKIVKHVKSNAIVVGNFEHTLGIGAGQMNRVQSARIALEQAGEKAKGAILASDAFIPMRDTVDMAAQYGIKTIIQTGGSIRDEEVIQAANEYGIAMIFTGLRHFKH